MDAKGWDKASVSEGPFQPFRSSRRCRLSSWLAESRRPLQRAGGIGVYRIIPKHLQTFVSPVRGSKWYDSSVTYTPIIRQVLLVLATGCWVGLRLAPPGTTMPPWHTVGSPSLCPKAILLCRRFLHLPHQTGLPTCLFPGCALFTVILSRPYFPISFQNSTSS